MYHSKLRDDDALILGASKVEQIEHSLHNLQKGPLESDVAQALDDLWTADLQKVGLQIVDPTKWKN